MSVLHLSEQVRAAVAREREVVSERLDMLRMQAERLHAVVDELGEEAHGAPFPRSAIGQPRAQAERTQVTWAEDPELGLYITCRLCPEGFDRYFVEVERQQATPRLLALIADHFAHKHPDISFAPELVWHVAQRPAAPLATFMPMVPQLPASIICACCPEGMNHIYLTVPPYGDARRLHSLLSQHPELREQTLGFSSRDQADHLEAWDRRLLERPDPRAGRRALERAREKTHTGQPDMLKDALARILLERVKAGEGITSVINDLAQKSLHAPTAFACTVGMAICELARSRGDESDLEFAARVTAWLLKPPTSSVTTLWRLWNKVKQERYPDVPERPSVQRQPSA